MLNNIKEEINIDISNLTEIDAGMSQETYMLKSTSGKKYFLKYTTDYKNLKRMYTCHLYQTNFVPTSIRKPTLIESKFTNKYAYTIHSYHKGVNPTRYINNKSFILTIVNQLGEIVRQLQDSNVDDKIKYKSDINKMVSDSLKYTKKSGYNNYIPIIQDAEEQLERSNYNQVFSHRDLHLDNLLLNPEKGIKYVVDWEHCRWTHPMYDLAKIELRFIDKFDYIGNNDASNLRNKLRESYGINDINYKDLYAIKLLHAYRTIGRIRVKNEAYNPWSQINSVEKIVNQYEQNIQNYADKFYE